MFIGLKYVSKSSSNRDGGGKGKKRSKAPSRKKSSPNGSDPDDTQPQDLELSDTQRNQIQTAFDIFDTKKTGSISCNEVKYAIESMGLELKTDELNKWLATSQKPNSNSSGSSKRRKRSTSKAQDAVMDVDQTVDIDFFTRIAASKLKEIEKSNHAFRLFDSDGKGFITAGDLKRAANDLQEESITDEELQEMIDEVDSEGHGIVNQDDFFRIMKKLNL